MKKTLQELEDLIIEREKLKNTIGLPFKKWRLKALNEEIISEMGEEKIMVIYDHILVRGAHRSIRGKKEYLSIYTSASFEKFKIYSQNNVI